MLGVREASLASVDTTEDLQDARGVVAHDGRLLLACADGALELRVVQPPGGRPMEASAYLRGHGAPGRA
jgi:methionyl-tRNA formyltransferase